MAVDKIVALEDEVGVVELDITDTPELAEPELDLKVEPKTEVKTKKTRVSASDDAASALDQAVKAAESEKVARAAAEATAASERQGRERAEAQAAKEAAESAKFRERAETSELTVVMNGIEAAKRDQEAAQAAWENSMAAADFAGASRANAVIANSAATIAQLTETKAMLESRPKVEVTKIEPTDTQSPFERYVANMAPRAQSWLRQHPQCVPPQAGGDASMNYKMLAGHNIAKAQGYAEGSDDYFRVIEEQVGVRNKVESKAAEVVSAMDQEINEPTPKKKNVQPSAPISRESPGDSPRLISRIVLTPAQQEAAKIARPDLPEKDAFALYAKGYIEAKNEGKLGRLTH